MTTHQDGPWIRFFFSDWLAGTRGLTLEETGAYIQILALIYETGEPIPYDKAGQERLARTCGVTKRRVQTLVQALLDSGKLHSTAGKLSNIRAERELFFRKKRRETASRSAQKRWQKKSKNPVNLQEKQGEDVCDAYANAMQNACELDATRSQSNISRCAQDISMDAANSENVSSEDTTFRERLLMAGGWTRSGLDMRGRGLVGTPVDMARIQAYLDGGLSEDDVIAVAKACRDKLGEAPGSLRYLDKPLQELLATRAQGAAGGASGGEDRAARLARYRKIAESS